MTLCLCEGEYGGSGGFIGVNTVVTTRLVALFKLLILLDLLAGTDTPTTPSSLIRFPLPRPPPPPPPLISRFLLMLLIVSLGLLTPRRLVIVVTLLLVDMYPSFVVVGDEEAAR